MFVVDPGESKSTGSASKVIRNVPKWLKSAPKHPQINHKQILKKWFFHFCLHFFMIFLDFWGFEPSFSKNRQSHDHRVFWATKTHFPTVLKRQVVVHTSLLSNQKQHPANTFLIARATEAAAARFQKSASRSAGRRRSRIWDFRKVSILFPGHVTDISVAEL